MPLFKDPAGFVAYRCFVQRLEISPAAAKAGGVEPRVWFQVVDRFNPTAIVGEYDAEPDADAHCAKVRAQRLPEVLRMNPENAPAGVTIQRV